MRDPDRSWIPSSGLVYPWTVWALRGESTDGRSLFVCVWLCLFSSLSFFFHRNKYIFKKEVLDRRGSQIIWNISETFLVPLSHYHNKFTPRPSHDPGSIPCSFLTCLWKHGNAFSPISPLEFVSDPSGLPRKHSVDPRLVMSDSNSYPVGLGHHTAILSKSPFSPFYLWYIFIWSFYF